MLATAAASAGLDEAATVDVASAAALSALSALSSGHSDSGCAGMLLAPTSGSSMPPLAAPVRSEGLSSGESVVVAAARSLSDAADALGAPLAAAAFFALASLLQRRWYTSTSHGVAVQTKR